ncbi:hypothetical protein OIU77_000699 [Salix suchowensis]|uniref:Uncharacterized protein n=1 Tax=Salix suchowensis TaxID=1278906 RepID=A0ABQ9B6Z9_9ROSI|nr:hypothetical protein OIU77_000699 [Salix suchowensis]
MHGDDATGQLPENANSIELLGSVVGGLFEALKLLGQTLLSLLEMEKAVKVLKKKSQGTTDGVQVPVNSEVVAYSTGKDPKQLALDKTLGFDPIRQHRHYCTWIVSTSSGARLATKLSALERQKEFSLPSTNSPPPSSVIKVDNPIASVRKLFMSPIKRTKLSSGSS